MTHTKQFIEDVKTSDPELFDYLGRQIELYLLNPAAWQAVGKTRGWKLTGDEWIMRPGEIDGVAVGLYDRNTPSYWFTIFMQHVWSGKTIEEALQAISE